jgi:ATP-dependent Clp protease ATP-binding subunit ClpA
MADVTLIQNAQTLSWCETIDSWVNPFHDLERRIKRVATSHILSGQDKKDLKLAFQLAYQWTWPATRMRNHLQQMPQEVIEELICDMLKHCREKDIPQKLEKYLSILNRACLLDLSDLKTEKAAATWFHSRGLIKNAQSHQHLEKEGRALIHEFAVELKHFIHHILEIFISLLGINEIGEKKHTRWSSEVHTSEHEAVSKLETYSKLIGYPAIIFGFIYTNIQMKAAAVALTACSITALVVALVAYQRYWKPCPKDHHGLKNLSIEILRSQDPIFVRQDILRKVERAFKEKKGVLLVGDPGSGKSWILRSIAQQIVEGKLCSFIKDPQIFACGASKFKSFNTLTLDSIEDRFGKYSDQTLFFFDEFHSFFKVDRARGASEAEDVKMFCEVFKYVVGATTTAEFEKYIKKQTAIADRRFVVIKVGKLENKKIKIILSQFLQAKHPTLNLDVKTLDYIIRKAKEFNPNTSKLDAARSLLNCAIKEMETIEFIGLESKIDTLEAEKKLLEQQLIQVEMGEDENLMNQLEKKQSEIKRFKKQLAKKNKHVKRLQKLEQYSLRLKEQSLRIANPKVKLIPNSALERDWILLQAKINVIGKFIEQKRAKLSLPARLDCDLIDQIIKAQSE